MSDRLPGSCWSNPIWYRGYRIYLADAMPSGLDWVFVHDDFDGAPDAADGRAGYANSVGAAAAEIDEMEADLARQPKKEQADV